MRKFHFWLFFCVCLAIGVGLGLALRPAQSATPRTINAETKTMLPPVRGVHVSSAANLPDLKKLAKSGINTLIVDSAADLSAITAEARKNKMQVYFTPRTSKLVPADVLAQAKAAAVVKAELFGIGYGLPDTGPDEETWTKLLTDVRALYTGRLAVVSDMTNYPYVTWWDLADVVAVAGAFDLPSGANVNSDHLRAAWSSHLLSLRSLVWRENKGLLMLNVEPSGKQHDGAAITAAAEALRGQEWFVGVGIKPPAAEITDALGKAWGK